MRTLAVVLVAITMLFSSVASLLISMPQAAFADDPVVTFPDPGLEAAIRDAIDKPSGDILQSDLNGLTELSSGSRGIVDLTGIEHCTSLQILDLQQNWWLSNISALAGLTGLQQLNLYECPLGNISALTNLINLQILNLGRTGISNTSALSGLTSLHTLYLSGWGGTLSDISGLSGLLNLQYLDLSNNNVSDISALSGLVNLQTLYLDRQGSGCGAQCFISVLSDISALSGLTSLQYVSLSDNKISVIPPLSGLTDLQELNLYLNPVSDISGLAGLTNLSTFVVGGPYVKGANISDLSALSSCPNLEYLNLAGCGVSNISPLSGHLNLKELYLEYNWLISDVSPLSGLISLEHLDLQGNVITDLSLSDLPNLPGLNLRDNQISHISELSGLPSLQYLLLSGNQLTDVSWLSDISSLLDLELNNNHITDIAGLSSFTIGDHLGLDSNQITDISALSNLSFVPSHYPTIALSYNNISDIKSLVDNANISTGDWVHLSCNPLSPVSIGTYIPALQDRGVGVSFTELPSVPTLLTPENESIILTLTPTLTWGYQEDASSYNLQVSTVDTFSTTVVDENDLTYNAYSFSSELDSGTTYYWRVDAVNCGGHSGWSDTWNFSTFEDEVVVFPDPGLETAVRDAIDKPSGDILRSDLVKITTLDASSRNISDLTGIEYCTSLTFLDLRSNNISDVLDLSGLTNLEFLALWNNHVNDISMLSSLTKLQTVEFGVNLISDISALSGLTSLESIFLAGNYIEDISPLSGLSNLTELQLEKNQIINVSALSGLTNLQMLGLAMNNISDISSLSALTSLGCLALWENNISDISALSGLVNLQTIDLASNQISNISTLAGLTNLQILQLGDNNISDVSALAGLTYIYELKLYSNNISDIQPLVDNAGLDYGDYVDLRNNPLNATSIDTYIPALEGRGVNIDYDALPPANDDFADAQVLSGDTGTVIDNNIAATKEAGEPNHVGNSGGASVWYQWQAPCNGSATFDTFGSDFDTLLAVYTGSSVDALTEIASNDDDESPQSSVEFTAVSGTTYWIAVDGYSGAEGEIYLNYEIVCGTPGEVVVFPDPGLEAAIRDAIGKPTGDIYQSDLDDLTSLDASYRDISDLTGIEHCTDLDHLILWNNNINDVSALSGLTSLVVLALDNNQISDISALSGLTSLTDLYLKNNYISDVSALSGLNSMQHLLLQTNNISDISALSGLTSLTQLDLCLNNISDVSALSGLTNLQNLFLCYNNLCDISALSGLTNLQNLNLNGNQINDISDLASLTSLNGLSLYDNQISDISSLSSLTNLIVLDLEYNQINDISELASLTNLGLLYLGDNQINDISALSSLTNLNDLSLYDNQISDISSLSNLTNLQYLDLEYNQISDISSLEGLTSLNDLYLGDNQISDIHPLVDNAGIDSGDYVDIRGNPLNTDAFDTHIPALQARGVIVDYDGLPPANDDFADAQALSGDTGTVIDNNAGATKEAGEPNHVGNSGGASVWYQWQAPCNGSATFDTFGSDFDTLLAVYTGSSVDALTEIASNDDDESLQSSVEFTAVSGTTYWIAVDGYSGAEGEIYLNYEIDCETPTAVSVSPLSQDVNPEQTFDVDIVVDPSVAIAGVQFNLSFDASLLQVNSITEGDLLNQGGCSTVFNPGNIDNDAGTITSVYGVINTPGCGVSDAGTFATISFTARDVQGISALNMSNVVVGDPDSNPVSFTLTNGSVHISKLGDLTGDNRVNVLDMIRIGQHWGQTGTPGWIPEDIKPDGVINVLDMIIIGQNWTG